MKYALTYVVFKELQICNILAKYRLEAASHEKCMDCKKYNTCGEFKNVHPLDFLSWVDDCLCENNVSFTDELIKGVMEIIKPNLSNHEIINISSVLKLKKNEWLSSSPKKGLLGIQIYEMIVSK